MPSSGTEPVEELDVPVQTVEIEADGTALVRETRPDRPRQHLAFIHALRGIAAMIVVWAHLGTIWVSLHGESAYSDRAMKKLVMQPFRVFQDGGHLGVILFFLISGYIITYTSLREDRTSFAVKRILRLGPPLVVALVVVWGYLQYADHLGVRAVGVHDGSVLQWARSVVLLDGWFGPRILDVTWTLVIEVIFYTLTFLLLGLSRARPEAATWAMTGLWAAVCVVVAVVPGMSTSVNVTLPGFVGFLIVGRAIYLWTAGIIRPIVAVLNAALGLLLYISFTERLAQGLVFGVTSPTAEPFYSYAYAIIIFLALMSWAPRRTVQPFTLLGDISYSLYLLHVPVGFAIFEVTSRWGFPPDLMIASAIAASILASWLSYRLVERPSQRLARNLLRRRKERANAKTVVLNT